MGLIKAKGKTASETRKGTLHGSQSRRRMAKWGGVIQRRDEKPGNASRPASKNHWQRLDVTHQT